MVRCRQNEGGYWDAFKICLWISMWCPLCENSLSCPFMIIIICTTPIKVYDIKEKELLIPSQSYRDRLRMSWETWLRKCREVSSTDYHYQCLNVFLGIRASLFIPNTTDDAYASYRDSRVLTLLFCHPWSFLLPQHPHYYPGIHAQRHMVGQRVRDHLRKAMR